MSGCGSDAGGEKAQGKCSVISASATLSAGLFNTGANLIALKAEWQNINLDEWICITVLPGQSITIYASGYPHPPTPLPQSQH